MIRPRRRLAAIGLAFALALTASGCVGAPPAPTPTPSPSFTGFASEDEAFDAADEIYQQYIEASNVQREGRVDADPLVFLAGDALHEAQEGVELRASNGETLVGAEYVEALQMESFSSDESIVLACNDIGDVRLLNSSSEDITPADRPSRVAIRVVVEPVAGELSITQLAGIGIC